MLTVSSWNPVQFDARKNHGCHTNLKHSRPEWSYSNCSVSNRPDNNNLWSIKIHNDWFPAPTTQVDGRTCSYHLPSPLKDVLFIRTQQQNTQWSLLLRFWFLRFIPVTTFLFLNNHLGLLIHNSGANSKGSNSSRTPYLGGPSFARADPSYARADPEQNLIASQRLPPMKEVPYMPVYRQSNYKDSRCYIPNNHCHWVPSEESEIRPGTLLGRSDVSCTLALRSSWISIRSNKNFRRKFTPISTES